MSRRKVLVIFVDALGPLQMKRFGPLLPGLDEQRSLRGTLGYSSGALATILTGAEPEVHGRMCLFSARQPDVSGVLEPLRWLGLLPRILHERARVRGVVARMLARASGLSGYVALHRVPPDAFGWLDLPEKEDLFQAKDIGGAATFLSDARAAGLDVYASPWQIPEDKRWDHVHDTLKTRKADLSFVYCAELDAALHTGGNHGTQGEDAVTRIGRHIALTREAMADDGSELLTLVLGDHGMADVNRAIDPRRALAELSSRYLVDSTMIRFWGDDTALAAARRQTEAQSWPGRWLDADALAQRAVPMQGSPYGSGFFLLNEGSIFSPSFVGGRVAGMHGYDVSANSASAALASDRPIPDDCHALSDVAHWIRDWLQLN